MAYSHFNTTISILHPSSNILRWFPLWRYARATHSGLRQQTAVGQCGVIPFYYKNGFSIMVQCSIVRYIMVYYGKSWLLLYTMEQYGIVWYIMVSYGLVLSSMVQYGLVWPSMVKYGLVWSSMVQYGLVWSSLALYGLAWYKMVWCGSVWSSISK